ncbi:MAG: flavodoxin family protein [Defluviitaleaceae bacterium]|nr:flavodoxin family protein [Defluviitaleaceae bacterium]
MKVLAINGSPRPTGNTAHMLKTVLEVCAKSGHETELYQAGGQEVYGCMGCSYCMTNKGQCMQGGWVNELYVKMKEADAIVIGSPTYFSDLTPETKALIDRTGVMSRKDGNAFSRKIGAAVTAVRRAGGIHTLDSINHMFQICDMIIPGSSYWNMSLSRELGDYAKDAEGIRTMERLGENIAWLLGMIEKDTGEIV